MEPNTASVVPVPNAKAVFGDVHCDLAKVTDPIHLIGIGGIGMSALARLLLAQGRAVSGSDKQASEITAELTSLGATIHIGHRSSNVLGAGGVVVSTAIVADNPELVWALDNDLPVWHRSRVLAALASQKLAIAVSGTHGKTTTTAMIAQVLIDCGADPSVVVGGIFPKIGSNACAGKGKYFVAEADESDGTHSWLNSQIAVVTSVEPDHLENYPGGINEIYQSMASFANHAKQAIVICADDHGCQEILPLLKGKVISYGRKAEGKKAVLQFESLEGFGLRVYKEGALAGEMQLCVPGEHNKLNAMAAVAVGIELGFDFKSICASLSRFTGVDRRFQLIGEEKGILVVDDYAHHPTEVAATLSGAKKFIEKTKQAGQQARRLVAVFQPHQPGRLRDFWTEFCNAFVDADLVLVTDIYVARGGQIEGINSPNFAAEIKHPDCHYLAGPTKDLAEAVKKYLRKNDLVLTIGAGDITTVGPQLVKLLKQA